MTNHPPSVLRHCWLGHDSCEKNRLLMTCTVKWDVKPCSTELNAFETQMQWSFRDDQSRRIHSVISVMIAIDNELVLFTVGNKQQ